MRGKVPVTSCVRVRKWLLILSLMFGLAATVLSIAVPELLRFYRIGSVYKEPLYPWAWPVEVPAGWPTPTENTRETGFSYELMRAANREDVTKMLFGWRLRMGWPLSVVEGGGFSVIPLPPTVRGPTTTNTIWTAHLGRGTMLFPYGVRPWALASNILLYAAAAFGVGMAIAAWRRGRRKCKGLCTACTYPLGGAATCPECGHAEA